MPMDQELALRQLQATTSFTFVGDKVLLRNTTLIEAVAKLQRQADFPFALSAQLAGMAVGKQPSSASH